MPKGRAVHQAQKKIIALARMLHRHSKIRQATVKEVAALADIKYPTIKSALESQSFSIEIEERLRHATGLDPSAPEWIDEKIDETIRRDDYLLEYSGRDTIENFEKYLERQFAKAEDRSGDNAGIPETVDKNLICHEAQIEKSDNSTEPKLCIQADFGFRYEAGIKYVMRRVRLTVTSDCLHGFASSRLGQAALYETEAITVSARGTDRQPFWDIVPTDGETAVLSGSVEIRTPPLASLHRYRPGACVSTQMLVNVLDGHIVPDPHLPELTGAQAALIERAFTLDFGTEQHENGWLTLTRHALKLAGED